MRDALVVERFETAGDPLDRAIVPENGAGTRRAHQLPAAAGRWVGAPRWTDSDGDGALVDDMVAG